MPVESCRADGKPGFRWGRSGKCFTYSTGAGRNRAIKKAQEQGRAIEASKRKSQ